MLFHLIQQVILSNFVMVLVKGEIIADGVGGGLL